MLKAKTVKGRRKKRVKKLTLKELGQIIGGKSSRYHFFKGSSRGFGEGSGGGAF